jgi:hypothetical protein
MPHTTPNPSGTLTTGCRPVAGTTASARTPDSLPGPSGVCAIWPQTHTDHLGRAWIWDAGLDCYRHADTDGGTTLALAETLADRQIEVRAGLPVNVFEWVFAHSRATGIARQVLLNLAWDEAADLEPPPWPGYLHLWFNTDDEPGDTNGTQFTESDLNPIADAVVELIALGELLLITTQVLSVVVPESTDGKPALPAGVDLSRSCPDVAYTLPAYQQWLVKHEVSW